MFTVVPLGTGSALPTRTRHLSATAVRREGTTLLLDCGEGTQTQMLRANLLRGHLAAVFVTHLHADHFLGVPGLLATLAMIERAEPLAVVGPRGLGDFLAAVPGAGGRPFELRLTEWDEGDVPDVVYEDDALVVRARPLAHRVPCAGYRVEERVRPGKVDGEAARAAGLCESAHFEAVKRGEAAVLPDGRVVPPDGLVGPPRPGAAFAYCLDTAPCGGAVELAHAADLVLHDATFGEAHAARAALTSHSTARQAAETARAAGARRLLLTHFSSRIADPAGLVAEARAVFPETDAAVEGRAYPVRPAAEEPEAAGAEATSAEADSPREVA